MFRIAHRPRRPQIMSRDRDARSRNAQLDRHSSAKERRDEGVHAILIAQPHPIRRPAASAKKSEFTARHGSSGCRRPSGLRNFAALSGTTGRTAPPRLLDGALARRTSRSIGPEEVAPATGCPFDPGLRRKRSCSRSLRGLRARFRSPLHSGLHGVLSSVLHGGFDAELSIWRIAPSRTGTHPRLHSGRLFRFLVELADRSDRLRARLRNEVNRTALVAERLTQLSLQELAILVAEQVRVVRRNDRAGTFGASRRSRHGSSLRPGA
jgi:hypothetical protein